MSDWLKLAAVIAALIIGAIWLVIEIRECRAKGGVLVQYSCVKVIE